MISMIPFAWISSVFATSFQFSVPNVVGVADVITNHIHPIHFTDNWNDFWGFLYFADDGSLDLTNDTPDSEYTIYLWNNESPDNALYICKHKMRWFYYNAERWEILWPLNSDTWINDDGNSSVAGLETEWWIYTECRDARYKDAIDNCDVEDRETCINEAGQRYPFDNSYYGAVIHKTNRWEEFSLVVGIKYDTKASIWIVPDMDGDNFEFAKTFMRVSNMYPVGFVYDYKWWIWFVWCEISENTNPLIWHGTLLEILKKINGEDGGGKKSIEDLFWKNESGVLVYKGSENSPVNCNKLSTAWDSLSRVLVEWIVWLNREWALGKQWNQTNTKMQYFASANINNATIINYAKRKSEILCRWKWISRVPNPLPRNDNSKVICVNGNVSEDDVSRVAEAKKTLIAKWNVTIKPNNSDYYDIFINGWNLIIKESSLNDRKKVFDTQWFPINDTDEAAFQSKMNDAINMEEWTINYDQIGNLSSVGLYINWNFIVDWNVEGADNKKLENKYFIYWKFTSKATIDDLEKTFTWRCNNWIATDGNYCLSSSVENGYNNPYANAVLTVINKDYDSPLYK